MTAILFGAQLNHHDTKASTLNGLSFSPHRCAYTSSNPSPTCTTPVLTSGLQRIETLVTIAYTFEYTSLSDLPSHSSSRRPSFQRDFRVQSSTSKKPYAFCERL